MFYHENKAKRNGFQLIIGVDEAGRGPLAGPVVAAAVSLRSKRFQNKIDDSKKISPRQREKAYLEIFEKAHVGLGIISEAVIDATNILQATYLAMTLAVNQLIYKLPETKVQSGNFRDKICLLVDGPSFKTDLPYAYRAIVNGDQLSMSIASASIVAKVSRDRILNSYDRILPQYGFRNHKGYPTLAHKEAIKKFGLSFIHRKTFHYSLNNE